MSCQGRKTIRPIASGGSYLSSPDPRVLVTLPPGESPADVTIHWPSGQVDRFSLEGDGYYRVLEGESPERTTPLP